MWTVYYLNLGENKHANIDSDKTILGVIDEFYQKHGYKTIIKIEKQCNTYL